MPAAEFAIANARIVTADEIVEGSVCVRGGVIADVSAGPSAAGADWDGDWLLPGLVELHTDNLERHVIPRPGVVWPFTPALIAHDAELVAAGITTVFDALRIGEWENEGTIAQHVDAIVATIDAAESAGILRADHRVHLRCEVCCNDTGDQFASLAGHDRIDLVSVMDHTPGQRQFTSLEKFAEYYGGKYDLDGVSLERFIAARLEQQGRNSGRHRKAIVAHCRERGIALASHDDTTREHVEKAVADNAAIAEFPTSVDAAAWSREYGLAVLMGAPNVVRGRSHSGNVSALDLARRGLLDILSSDYVPSSLIQAAFQLPSDVPELSLPEAVQRVSRTPARAVGLDDRGEIAPGKRADLVRVRIVNGSPIVREVWRQGERAA
jgi:alpha-D-ribose 1-methylphosphonate 5-triphosphate diphosphatase